MHELNIFTFSVLSLFLSYYLITNLQWYNYSLRRVLFKHHKQKWHIFYFFVPIIFTLLLLVTLPLQYSAMTLNIVLLAFFTPYFILWVKKLDKKLVFTGRVKRYFLFIIIFIILSGINYYFCNKLDSKVGVILSFLIYILGIFLGLFCSKITESIIFNIYAKQAKYKLKSLSNLLIIAITGSYGKTSIKNFITAILHEKYNVYSSPRSVNTFKGLVADINENLNPNHEIYVAEAGARAVGDVGEISLLLQQHYAVIGKIGNAHIEYFKSLENTYKAKFELLESTRLIKALIQKDNNIKYIQNLDKIELYPPQDCIKNIESNLDFTSFSLLLDSKWVDFKTKILGRFNIDNIVASVLLGFYLGVDILRLQKAVANLQPVAHRLQRIDSAGKIILDDSFNGNLEGMSEAIHLSSLHNGRKVIITPGLVEQDKESNITLANLINDVFDLAIITGALNAELLDTYITKPSKILLKDKSNMESILAQNLGNGDLVLFANDAPNFV